MIRCVVWDWNGTLLNDVEVAFSAMNQMLSRRGLPRLESLSAYREIFTFPVRDYYVAAGLDLERESFSELAVEWTQLYNRFYPSCGLFPKAAEILKAVQGMGLRQLLVSASQQQALDRQVEEQGLTGCFEAQLGISNIYAGSKAGLAQAYFQRQGICPQEAGRWRKRPDACARCFLRDTKAGACWRQRAFRCWTAWRRYSPFWGKAKGVKENNPART